MSDGSPDSFAKLQRAFDELWRGNRTTLKATTGVLLSQLAAIKAKDCTNVDWQVQVERLTNAAEGAARSMSEATVEKEPLGQVLLLCAITLELAITPNARSLSILRSLAYHSWVLEHSLANLILLAMNEDEVTRLSWNELLKGWLWQTVPAKQPAEDPLDHHTWGDVFRPNKLHASLDDLVVPLTVLLEVDAAFSFACLESIPDWEYVELALLRSGVVSTFERWSSALAQASPSFTASGNWTGSVVGLLLMKRAQEELLLPEGDRLFGRSLAEPLWSCESVVAAARNRTDWLPMLRCWSVSMSRDYIDTADSVSRGNQDRRTQRLSRLEQVFDGMPVEVRETRSTSELPTGYPAWFVWYERALEVHWHAQLNPSLIPSAQVIALYSQVANWDSTVCVDLRRHRAQIIFGRSDLFVGGLDFQLGVAVAAAQHPVNAWHTLWQGTFSLREMTEFGGCSEDDSEDWQGRSAASSLTELVLRLGLAIAQTMLQSSTPDWVTRRSEACLLLGLLQTSAMEMASIEIIKTDVWAHALRYVLLLWGRFRALEAAVDGAKTGAPRSEERQLLEYLSADPTELLLALAACAKNGITEKVLANQLADARIDLGSALSQARKFSDICGSKERLPNVWVPLAERLCNLIVPG